jgi:hypothetical protein
MKNADVQRSVYYWVVKSLEDADYKVSMEFRGTKSEDQRVFLLIKWFKKQDETLKKYMDSYIKKHTRRSEQHTPQTITINRKK